MFELAPLPYAYDALMPVLSRETLEYHHDRHHRAYVDKVNELIQDKDVKPESLDELILTASGPLYNQAAQAWNHDFYWRSLRKPGGPGPGDRFVAALERRYGAVADFTKAFEEAGATLFGSGWVWLVTDTRGELQIFSGHDAENPRRHHLEPLLTCDVWEHAYYIDYRNGRKNYLQAFWDIVDWKAVEDRYARSGVAGAPD